MRDFQTHEIPGAWMKCNKTNRPPHLMQQYNMGLFDWHSAHKTSVRDLRPHCLVSTLDVISWSTTFDSPAFLCWEQRQGEEEEREWENLVKVWQFCNDFLLTAGCQSAITNARHMHTHTHPIMKTCHIHAWVTLCLQCIYAHYLFIFKKIAHMS